MAAAIWQNSKEHSDSEIKSAFTYMSNARKQMPNERKFDEMFSEITKANEALREERKSDSGPDNAS